MVEVRGAGRLSVAARHLLVLAAAAIGTAAPAQQPDPAAGDEIVVTGRREATLDLKRLLKAQAIFRENRAAFAPQSALAFEIRPRPDLVLPGMTLALRQGDRTVPVPIAEGGRFVLPDVGAGDWELVHNRGRSTIVIRALVLSPGASEADRPLGDLRLQCRVTYELMKPALSFVQRSGFAALGGCASGRIGFYFSTRRPVTAATITIGERSSALPLRADRRAFRVPIGDRRVPNAARVRLAFD